MLHPALFPPTAASSDTQIVASVARMTPGAIRDA